MDELLNELLKHVLLFICSSIANILSAISGGGAGFFQFSILILMGLPFMSALGTHKASTLLLGVGAITKKGNINRLSRLMASVLVLVGVPGCVLGTWLVSLIDEVLAEFGLGIITIAMAIYTLTKRSIDKNNVNLNDSVLSKSRIILGIILILLTALLSGALSSGAGLFATMVMISVFKLNIKDAITHAVVFIETLWNLVGAITVYQVAEIHWQWVPTLLLASFVGGLIGSKLLKRLSNQTVRYIFAFVAAISGILLLRSSIQILF